MYKMICLAATSLMIMGTELKAQPIDLSFYTDANGLIDVQKLTCDQLRNTYQGDADALTTWCIGWYNGLAKTHYLDFRNETQINRESGSRASARAGVASRARQLPDGR